MSGLLARVTGNSGGSPGPGAYSIRTSVGDAPKYTFKSRHDLSSRPVTAPYRDLPSTVGAGPKIALASRHQVRGSEATPGPSYVPPPLGQGSQKSSLSYRHAGFRDSRADNPGPGAYSIPARFGNEANKFTLHSRTGTRDDATISPGPAAYSPDINATRRRAPSASMHVRTPIRDREQTPGYVDLGSTLRGRGCTIGRRETLDLIAI
jgi:hypothetical protein